MINLNNIFWITFFISSFAISNNKSFVIIHNSPAKKNNIELLISGGYQTKTKYYKNSNLTAKTKLTLYSSNLTYNFWGNAINNSSNNKRLSEIYQLGVKSQYNLTKFDYFFSQLSWLTDRYNGLNSENIFIIGCGKQIFNNLLHSSKIEIGPSVIHKYFTNGNHEITKLGYIGANYETKINNNTKFKQNISFFSFFNKNYFSSSETTLQIMVNNNLSLNFVYNINYNNNYLFSTFKCINIKTSIQLAYILC